jgi:CheY-like chemotaxis protein
MIAYYYPTTIICLDDNKGFLRAISNNLKGNNFEVETYVDPDQVQNILDNANISDSNNNLVQEIDGVLLGDRAININISNISKQRSLIKKSNNISVLLIDNDMPQIQGLDFLDQLNNNKTYRILLTGQEVDNKVISAFNSGVIDSYINKSDINLVDNLIVQINEGINKYFSKSSLLIQQVIASDKSRSTALSSACFNQFFTKIIRQKNIVEYYLIDAQGSYLMVDKLGNKYTLLILEQENALAHLDLLQENGIEECESENVILQKKMLYFNDQDTLGNNFYELDERISNLDGYMYKIFDGDILNFMR